MLRQFVTMYMYDIVHVHVYVTQSRVLVCLGHSETVAVLDMEWCVQASYSQFYKQ